jgi:ribonuclease J
MTGCLDEHVLICEDGDTVLLEDGRVTRGEPVPTSHVYIDGLLDDVGPALLRDRRRIGEDGICIAHRHRSTRTRPRGGDGRHPEGRGVPRAADEILEAPAGRGQGARGRVGGEVRGHGAIQRHVVQALGRFWREETGRRPFILIVQDV